MTKMPRYTIILALLLVLCNCGLLNREAPRVVVLEKYPIQLEQTSTLYKVESSYYPLKSSPVRDTLYIVSEGDPERSNLLIHYDSQEYRFPKKGELNIFIDTSRIIANWGQVYWLDSAEYVIPHAEMAYAVTLSNMSKDSLSVGGSFYIPLDLEALDSNGHWRPIESFKPKVRRKDYAHLQHILPPRHVTITTLSIPSGNYPTKLRLSWNGNYSNTVYGWINYGQFALPEEK